MNPEASITAMDVSNITDPIAGLKATQLGIAGDIGKVPVAKVEGSNLLKMNKDALINYVVKTITPEVVSVFIKSGKLPNSITKGQGLAEAANLDKMKQKITKVKYAIAEYVWKNVEQMQQNNQPVSGAPGRNIMPQTDDATNWEQDAVNAQAVKETKRLQQLAGILNEEEYRKKLEETVLEGEDKNLVTDPRILALAAKITKQSVDKVEDKVDAVLTGKEEENKGEVKESLGITITLAIPMLLEAGGSLAGWINKKYGLSKEELVEYKKWQLEYNKLKKRIESYTDIKLTDPKTKRYVDNKKAELAKMKQEGDKKFGGKLSKLLKEAGHGLHLVYTSPIRALLWTISLFTPKGSDLRNPKIREKIANIIYAAGMIGFAGYGIFHSIQHLAGVSEAATAIIDGTKGGKSVSEIVKDVPTVVKAFAT